MPTYTLNSSEEAAATCDCLIDASSPFSLEPWPDDEWRVTLKDEVRPRLELRLGRELLAALLLFFLLPLAAQAQEPCKVNVQTCTAAECAYLPGIGPAKGAAIEAAHPADEAALDAVPGIGEATLAKIRPHVAYDGPTTCTSKQVAPKPEAPKQ